MLTGLNSAYARRTDVRGLPVPLWRFGVSLLFFALLLGGANCQEELDLTIANVALVLGRRCCADGAEQPARTRAILTCVASLCPCGASVFRFSSSLWCGGGGAIAKTNLTIANVALVLGRVALRTGLNSLPVRAPY